jgi:hypothetical protein
MYFRPKRFIIIQSEGTILHHQPKFKEKKMSKNDLYEILFKLRAAQANCTANERASYEPKIAYVLKLIASMR